MKSLHIEDIEFNDGLAGSRIAIISPPQNAPPASLCGLKDFLNDQQGIRAIPGYDGTDTGHVLKVSGLQNDESLLTLLTQTWPEWKHNKDHCNHITIDPNICSDDSQQQGGFNAQAFGQFVKDNASSVTAGMFLVGNMGLLISGLQSGKEAGAEAQKDWYKIGSSIAYNAASLLFIATAHNADASPSAASITQECYDLAINPTKEEQQKWNGSVDKALDFIRTHPWEMSGAINALGAGLLIASTVKNGTRTETMAACGTLTAMLMTMLIPEKEEDIYIPKQNNTTHSMADTLDYLHEHEPYQGATKGLIEQGWDWMREHPLIIPSGIQIISNSAFGMNALQSRDPGMMTAAGSYLTGNFTSMLASKGHGTCFDDVVSTAADLLHSDPLLADASPDYLDQRIDNLAAILAEHNDVKAPQHALSAGIKQRMTRYDGHSSELTSFLDPEVIVMRESPFISTLHTQRLADDTAQNTDAVSPML